MRTALKRIGVLLLAMIAICILLDPARAQATDGAAAPGAGAAWWASSLPLAWLALTAIVNTLSHAMTPKDVDAWAEANPRLAQLAAIMRRFGIEPVAGIAAIFAFFRGDPPPPGHAAAVGRSTNESRPANDTGRARGLIDMRVLTALTFLACSAWACGLIGAVVPAAATGVCVYDFVKTHPGLTLLEYAAQAAVACETSELGILDALIASDDPALAPLRDEAKALRKAGGTKLAAFAAAAHQRAGAIRAAADGGAK